MEFPLDLMKNKKQTASMPAIVFIVLPVIKECSSLLCIKNIKEGDGEEVKEEHRK